MGNRRVELQIQHLEVASTTARVIRKSVSNMRIALETEGILPSPEVLGEMLLQWERGLEDIDAHTGAASLMVK